MSKRTIPTSRRRVGLLAGVTLAVAAAASALATTGLARDEQQGPTVVYAVTATPPDIDPNSSAEFVESELFTNTMSRLVDFRTVRRADGTYVMQSAGYSPVTPGLATRWTVSKDRKTITMDLRRNVRNHLGHAFDAKDVRYTVDRLLALKGTGTFYLSAIGITKSSNLRVINSHRIQFKIDFPAVLFFKMLAIPHLGIVDSVEFKKNARGNDRWATQWAHTHNVGWGPYYIQQNQPGVQVVLKRDPNYWGKRPQVETVIEREVPASANRLALLKGGAVDIVAYLQPRERITLRRDSKIQVVSFSPAQTHSILYMTTTKRPFNNRLVRQAVCNALPYEQIVRTIGLGTARRQHTPLPANYQFYSPATNPYKSQNIARARQLLRRAGLPNGFKTSIGFSNDDPTVEQQAQIVQSALRQIGIEASLLKQPFATYSQNWLGAKYEMGMMYEGAFIPDFTYALHLWYYGPKKANFLNFTDYHNRQVNKLLDESKRTFDEKRRKTIATTVQRLILRDAPVCYLVEPGVHFPARRTMGGLNYYTYSAQHFDLWTKR